MVVVYCNGNTNTAGSLESAMLIIEALIDNGAKIEDICYKSDGVLYKLYKKEVVDEFNSNIENKL